MNAPDTWPLPEEVPEWWLQKPMTPEHLEMMREEYEREQIADAKSAEERASNVDAAGTFLG